MTNSDVVKITRRAVTVQRRRDGHVLEGPPNPIGILESGRHETKLTRYAVGQLNGFDLLDHSAHG
jgi:hypothetical protein